MKVTDDLRRFCELICDAERTSTPLPLRHGRYRCVLGESAGVSSDPLSERTFLIECRIRDWPHFVELSHGEVFSIAQGIARDIEFSPKDGVHPEDLGLARVEVDIDVLRYAIRDAINRFVRTQCLDSDACPPNSIAEIVDEVAASWHVSWRGIEESSDT